MRWLGVLVVLALAGCGGDDPEPVHADDLAVPEARPSTTVVARRLGPVAYLSADAGALVWTAPRRNGSLDLVARPTVDARPRRILRGFQRLPRDPDPGGEPRRFDVGRGPGGRPVVVWTQGCGGEERGACVVRALPVAGGRSRILARLPGNARPPVAIDGRDLAYVVHEDGCDVLMARRLPDGSPRRLGRGTCGAVREVDLEDGRVAAAVGTNPPPDDDGFPTEAWLASSADDDSVRIAQDEDAGYSGPDAITAALLDGDALYTARRRDEGPSQLVRLPFDGGAPSAVRLPGDLYAGVARDRGRTYTVESDANFRRFSLVVTG